MKYSPERRGTIKEIEHLGPSFVRIKTHRKTMKGWSNFRLNRNMTWSFNYSNGSERLWLNAPQGNRVYCELEGNDLVSLISNVILILHFRAYFGSKLSQIPTDVRFRVKQKYIVEAKREFAKWNRIKTRRKNKVLGQKYELHDLG